MVAVASETHGRTTEPTPNAAAPMPTVPTPATLHEQAPNVITQEREANAHALADGNTDDEHSDVQRTPVKYVTLDHSEAMELKQAIYDQTVTDNFEDLITQKVMTIMESMITNKLADFLITQKFNEQLKQAVTAQITQSEVFQTLTTVKDKVKAIEKRTQQDRPTQPILE